MREKSLRLPPNLFGNPEPPPPALGPTPYEQPAQAPFGEPSEALCATPCPVFTSIAAIN